MCIVLARLPDPSLTVMLHGQQLMSPLPAVCSSVYSASSVYCIFTADDPLDAVRYSLL